MKDWSIKLSTLLTVLSIVGTIVIGSIAFGELRGGVIETKERMRTYEERMLVMEKETREINQKLTQVSTDLQWIRALIEGYAKKVHNIKNEEEG